MLKRYALGGLVLSLLTFGHEVGNGSAKLLQHQDTVSVDVRNEEAGAVLRSIASQAGVLLVMPQGFHGVVVRLKVERGNLRDVMKSYCSLLGCEWEISTSVPPTLVVMPPSPEVRMARMESELETLRGEGEEKDGGVDPQAVGRSENPLSLPTSTHD